MMSSFVGYEKVDESSLNWKNSRGGDFKASKVEWCVTEKIHGSNFCFLLDSSSLLQCAKRRAILASGEAFFNYEKVVDDLKDKIVVCFEYIKELVAPSTLHQILIFGELFGGSYPHSEVAEDKSIPSPVQSGIYYSPSVHFCAFDIAIIKDADTSKQYMDYSVAIEVFKHAEMLYAAPLFVGKYNQAIQFNPLFNTTIPAKLGLPEIKDNYAEGIVIKPMKNTLVLCNSNKTPTTRSNNDNSSNNINKFKRPLLKIKIAQFSESKYQEATKWESKKVFTVDESLNPLDELLYEVHNIVTDNRLNNAVSKIGRIILTNNNNNSSSNSNQEAKDLEKKRIVELFNLLKEDVLDEFTTNGAYSNSVNSLSPTDRSVLEKAIVSSIKKLMKTYIKQQRNKHSSSTTNDNNK